MLTTIVDFQMYGEFGRDEQFSLCRGYKEPSHFRNLQKYNLRHLHDIYSNGNTKYEHVSVLRQRDWF